MRMPPSSCPASLILSAAKDPIKRTGAHVLILSAAKDPIKPTEAHSLIPDPSSCPARILFMSKRGTSA